MSVAVLGSINMDIVLSVPDIPKPGETVTATRRALYPGGKGANRGRAHLLRRMAERTRSQRLKDRHETKATKCDEDARILEMIILGEQIG